MHTFNLVVLPIDTTFHVQRVKKLHALCRAALATDLGILSVENNSHTLKGVALGLGIEEVYDTRADS